jgi:hypothetical protein
MPLSGQNGPTVLCRHGTPPRRSLGPTSLRQENTHADKRRLGPLVLFPFADTGLEGLGVSSYAHALPLVAFTWIAVRLVHGSAEPAALPTAEPKPGGLSARAQLRSASAGSTARWNVGYA